MPTPDEMGLYRDLTLEQAQAIVPFEILVPEQVPDGLEPPSITVIESPVFGTGGRNYRVEVYFELSGDESPRKSVLFMQVQGDVDFDLPESETTTSTVNGVEVNRSTGVNAGGNPLLFYWWKDDGIGYQILAAPEGDLTPALIEDLMLAILSPPAPTVEDQTALLERERSEMRPFPNPDTCDATSWVGPDFRVRRSEAAAYFIDGDGLTLGTTHGLLFGGENESPGWPKRR